MMFKGYAFKELTATCYEIHESISPHLYLLKDLYLYSLLVGSMLLHISIMMIIGKEDENWYLTPWPRYKLR